MKKRWSPWVGAIIAWSTLGVLFALPIMTADNWRRALFASLLQWWCWGLLAPLIFWIDKRLHIGEKQLAKRAVAHLPLSVLATLLYTAMVIIMGAITGFQAWSVMVSREHLASLVPALLWSWLVYWVIFGVQQTYRYYRHYLDSEVRIARIERSSSEARLNALRMQLDPHFLFNALNTISAQVEHDPRLARTMIEHLGDLLRLSLDTRLRQEVTLAEELDFLNHYLAIQKIRFADNLAIQIRVDSAIRHALVPALIVQPLVENAIRHGLSHRASGGTVSVTAERGTDQVEIHIADDGVGLPPGWTLETSVGTGLSVTRERILGLHPDGNARFSVRPRENGGTLVDISLPLKFAETS